MPTVYTVAHPHTSQVKLNTNTLLLNSPNGQHSLNSMYEVPLTTTMLEHLSVFTQDLPTPKEETNHVYKLLIIDPAI